MKVVVAGADGYLGSRVCDDLLSSGAEVVGVIPPCTSVTLSCDEGLRKRFSVVYSNDATKETIGNADVVINLAWIGVGGALQGDYGAQIKSMELTAGYYSLAKQLGARRFISVGTVSENQVGVVANLKKYRNANYIIAKSAIRDMLLASESAECKVVWAQLGTLYGENCRGRTLMAYAAEQIKSGNIAEFGPGEQYYDFVHRDDCARALRLLASAEGLNSSIYYIGSGEPRKLKDFLVEVGTELKHPELVKIGARPDDGSVYLKEWFDIGPMTRDTGYIPKVDFVSGLRRLYG